MTNIATEYRTLVVKERAAFFDPRCTQLRDRMTDADIQRTVAMLSFLSSIRIDRGSTRTPPITSQGCSTSAEVAVLKGKREN
jgi:hypothetical protein